MKIVSHNPTDVELLRNQGTLVINGVKFDSIFEGRACASYATEEQCHLFSASQGFSFYHDDGTLSGESGGAQTLSAAPPMTKEAATQEINRLIQDGKLSKDELLDLLGQEVAEVSTKPSREVKEAFKGVNLKSQEELVNMLKSDLIGLVSLVDPSIPTSQLERNSKDGLIVLIVENADKLEKLLK